MKEILITSSVLIAVLLLLRMIFAKKVAAQIKAKIACKKVAVVVLGLEVPHAHIHLIPINSEKDVDFHREKLQLTPEEFASIAAEIAVK